MIRLHFSIAGPREITAGPAAAFRFDAHGVTASPGGREIAKFSDRMWQVGGQHFTRCECRAPARVQFEDSDGRLGALFGPFGSLAFYGGSLYAGKTLLARYDDGQQSWYAVQTKADHWAIRVLA